MLAAVPAFADQTSRAAPVTDGFLTIAGPKKLHASPSLRVPIRCSVECDTTAFTKLTLDDEVIGPDKVTSHLPSGHPRNLIVTLNDAAAKDLEDHFGLARLRIGVWAVSSDTQAKVHAVKVFRFTGP